MRFFAVGLLALSLFLAGCATLQKQEPLPLVQNVSLDQFMGTWYVIGATPTLLDREPYNAVEVYSRGDRGIDITYQFNSGGFDGELKTFNSRAMVDNPGINSDWEVTYAWPFGTDFKILHLEPDYSVTVVGNPNRKWVWIMARQPQMSDPLYSDIILYLQDLGFDIGKIRKVPHN
jgi:apolipoprotein D and lipocalin family protein